MAGAAGGGHDPVKTDAAATAAAAGLPPPSAAKTRTGYLLALQSGMGFGAEVAVRQAAAQLWINYCRGDTVRLAILRGKLVPVCQLFSFYVTPVLGVLSDRVRPYEGCAVITPVTRLIRLVLYKWRILNKGYIGYGSRMTADVPASRSGGSRS